MFKILIEYIKTTLHAHASLPRFSAVLIAFALSNCSKTNDEIQDKSTEPRALAPVQSLVDIETSSKDTYAAVELPGSDTKDTSNETFEEAPPKSVETAFVGDVMFGRYDENGLVPNPPSYLDTFDRVKALLVSDVTVVNLETPLLREPFEKCPWPPRLRFVAPPAAADALKTAGFHVANLANNHVFDMRNKGVEDTRDILKEKGIVAVGAPVEKGRNPFVMTTVSANGQKLAFIPITTVRNSVDGPEVPDLPYTPREEDVPSLLAPLIAEARRSHDRVLVFAHWGPADEPSPRKTRREAARALIDLGADAVIGHGAHVLQGVELYKQGLIAHSLGDFLFDVVWDERRLSGVLKLTFDPGRKCPARVAFHPVVTVQTQTGIYPIPAKGLLRKTVVDRMVRLSKAMGTVWEDDGEMLAAKLPDTCGQ